MGFIASFWWLWLIIFLTAFIYALINQIRRMKGMVRNFDKMEAAEKNFFADIKLMIVAFLIAAVSFFLLLISAIIHLVNYLK